MLRWLCVADEQAIHNRLLAGKVTTREALPAGVNPVSRTSAENLYRSCVTLHALNPQRVCAAPQERELEEWMLQSPRPLFDGSVIPSLPMYADVVEHTRHDSPLRSQAARGAPAGDAPCGLAGEPESAELAAWPEEEWLVIDAASADAAERDRRRFARCRDLVELDTDTTARTWQCWGVVDAMTG